MTISLNQVRNAEPSSDENVNRIIRLRNRDGTIDVRSSAKRPRGASNQVIKAPNGAEAGGMAGETATQLKWEAMTKKSLELPNGAEADDSGTPAEATKVAALEDPIPVLR